MLAVYLNNHLAGATGGTALARRLARNHRGTELEGLTGELADQVAEHRTALLQILTAVGVRPRQLRQRLSVLPSGWDG